MYLYGMNINCKRCSEMLACIEKKVCVFVSVKEKKEEKREERREKKERKVEKIGIKNN